MGATVRRLPWTAARCRFLYRERLTVGTIIAHHRALVGALLELHGVPLPCSPAAAWRARPIVPRGLCTAWQQLRRGSTVGRQPHPVGGSQRSARGGGPGCGLRLRPGEGSVVSDGIAQVCTYTGGLGMRAAPRPSTYTRATVMPSQMIERGSIAEPASMGRVEAAFLEFTPCFSVGLQCTYLSSERRAL